MYALWKSEGYSDRIEGVYATREEAEKARIVAGSSTRVPS